MVKSYIKDGEININKAEWECLNNNHTKEEIINLISDQIGLIEFPFDKISECDAVCDFNNLKKLSVGSIIKRGSFFTKSNYAFNATDLYIQSNNTGGTSSNYFHHKARMMCDSLNSPSPFRIWGIEKFRKNMLKNLWTMPTDEINSERLRNAINMRNYTASQFRPSAAKALYSLFNSKRVLDFCSGWGDRLSGFSSIQSTELYVGVDPNSNLHINYNEQVKLYQTGKRYIFYDSCAEDTVYNEKFDTVFTSPPYMDIERYSNDDNQSWKKYKWSSKTGCADWLNNFLFKSIRNAWDALGNNGVMAINIADVYGHHVWNKICDPMNEYISTLPDAKYYGMIGYRMAKRPNSMSDKNEKIFAEPIWVWYKSNDGNFGVNENYLVNQSELF